MDLVARVEKGLAESVACNGLEGLSTSLLHGFKGFMSKATIYYSGSFSVMRP